MTSKRSVRSEQEARQKARDPIGYTRGKMLRSARERAKAAGLPFNITLDDIIIPKVCPVLGIEITPGIGTGRARPGSPSLDRIIPELGYVRGNVIVTSHRANTLKNNATVREMRRVASFYEQLVHPNRHQ